MKPFLLILLAIFIGFVIFAALSLARLSGAFDEGSAPHGYEDCQSVPAPIGAEDIAFDPKTGLAYLSAYDRNRAAADDTLRGGIYLLDPSAQDPKPQTVTPAEPRDFRPHGVSLHRQGEEARLFVINHRASGEHSVELFRITAENALEHLKTLRDPAFLYPNDIAALDGTRFYMTNNFGTSSAFGNAAEVLLRLPFSNLVYFDGEKAEVAADGLRFANGIHLSDDGETLYVAEWTGRALRLYRRNGDGSLALQQTIETGGSPDNISQDEEGALYLPTHASLFGVIALGADENAIAPTRVLKITPPDHGLEEIYYEEGNKISAATVAAIDRGVMLMGSIFGKSVLMCRLAEGG